MKCKTTLLMFFLILSLSLTAQWSFDTSECIKNNHGLYSIVISMKGQITYERYFNGHQAKELYNNQSLTKSIMSLLIGIAIDKGFISSVDEPIMRYFPALRRDPDRRKQLITIREIMNQASGLWHEDLDSIPEYLDLTSPSDYVLTKPLVSAPGQEFHYNNAASHLLSVVITRATGMNTLVFAMKYLFAPLSIANVRWGKMRDGYYDGCGLLSVHISTTDLNKIGNLILEKGLYRGKQIVSTNWIRAVTEPEKTYATPWGFQPSRYALCYYHNKYKGKELTYGLGWGGQFLILLPDKDVVIAVTENPNNQGALHQSISFTSQIFTLIWNDLYAN